MAGTSATPNRGSDRDSGIQTGTDQPGTFWEPGTRTGRDVSQTPDPLEEQPNQNEPETTEPGKPDEKAQKELEKGRRDREDRNENAF